MKALKVIAKIVVALAAIAGIVYVVATYGDRIVAWARKLLNRYTCCCDCECDCDECDCGDACENCQCECAGDCSDDCDESCVCDCEQNAAETDAVVAEQADFEG